MDNYHKERDMLFNKMFNANSFLELTELYDPMKEFCDTYWKQVVSSVYMRDMWFVIELLSDEKLDMVLSVSHGPLYSGYKEVIIPYIDKYFSNYYKVMDYLLVAYSVMMLDGKNKGLLNEVSEQISEHPTFVHHKTEDFVCNINKELASFGASVSLYDFLIEYYLNILQLKRDPCLWFFDKELDVGPSVYRTIIECSHWSFETIPHMKETCNRLVIDYEVGNNTLNFVVNQQPVVITSVLLHYVYCRNKLKDNK